jgi:hypothetical protein
MDSECLLLNFARIIWSLTRSRTLYLKKIGGGGRGWAGERRVTNSYSTLAWQLLFRNFV